MSRRMSAEDDTVYRVRVAITYTSLPGGSYGGETVVRYYGPYRTLGAAKTQKRRETPTGEGLGWHIESAESEIQAGHFVWETI